MIALIENLEKELADEFTEAKHDEETSATWPPPCFADAGEVRMQRSVRFAGF